MRASTRIRGISGSAKRCRGLPRRWAWTSRPLSPEIDCDSALAFCLSMIFSEDRFPLFPIMLRNRARTSDVDNFDLAAFAVLYWLHHCCLIDSRKLGVSETLPDQPG